MFIRAVKHQANGAITRYSQKILLNTDLIISVEELKDSGKAVVMLAGITENEIVYYVLDETYEYFVSEILGKGETK